MRSKRVESHRNIFITGLPGSGKSRFGRAYARFARMSFLDFDDFFEKSERTTIAHVFATSGLEGFRAAESKVLQSLSHRNNCVIALGGGTLLTPKNDEFARRHGFIVFLNGLDVDTLALRIWNDKINTKARVRPLFADCKTLEHVRDKIKVLSLERMHIYETADLILNQNFNSQDNMMLTLNCARAEQNFDGKESWNEKRPFHSLSTLESSTKSLST